MTLIAEPLHACGLVESSWVRARAACFARHTHDELVLGANLAGHEQIWLDGKHLEVPPGAVTLYNPLAVQASTFGPQGVEYISLHLDINALQRTMREHDLGPGHGCPTFEQGVLQQPALYRSIIDFAGAATVAEQEAALWQLLAELFEQPASAKGEQAPAIEHSVTLMRTHLDQRLTLEQLARAAGLSKFHFVRCFKKAMGLGPLQYHMQLRLIEARRRLRTGAHPRDVALGLGFYDQSHFINAFGRVMGITPTAYSATFRRP
ncbi:AraC family transcriptional regulator [Pseudomonas sp. GD03860]|uniref:helix-turn-helix transcriptional regulator n=1 Tax=Pseudomonas TaxID=286 RepID=UPI002363B6E2|nr:MULTISPECIES: AraC family transcriptional regulator [Pseudomonas]MDD2060917.1 AraC family transcriptional regulator [Pseudomonas putida]MDH0638400.1 AraC family transcriptional regulator [Pseudomonas sp. GD03860]